MPYKVRASKSVKPELITLEGVYNEINQIMTLQNAPLLCQIIGNDDSSIVISKSKNVVRLDCDIPSISMSIVIIKKDSKYQCIVYGGDNWYSRDIILETSVDININSVKLDEIDKNNFKLLVDLIHETYNTLSKEDTNNV